MMTAIDRWIIGALVMALGTVLWQQFRGYGSDISQMRETVALTESKVKVIESRLEWIDKVIIEIRSDARDQRNNQGRMDQRNPTR